MDIIINGEIIMDLNHVMRMDVMNFHDEKKQLQQNIMCHLVWEHQVHVSIENL